MSISVDHDNPVRRLLLCWVFGWHCPFLQIEQGGNRRECESKMSIYRDQLGEVERDLASGLISEDEADQARQEIESRRSFPHKSAARSKARTSARRPLLAALILILVWCRL